MKYACFIFYIREYINHLPVSVSIDTYNCSKTQPHRTTHLKEMKSSSKRERETKMCLNTSNPITKWPSIRHEYFMGRYYMSEISWDGGNLFWSLSLISIESSANWILTVAVLRPRKVLQCHCLSQLTTHVPNLSYFSAFFVSCFGFWLRPKKSLVFSRTTIWRTS